VNAMPVRRATGGSQDHDHILQEKQGPELTNQCLGKKRMNSERGAEESFLPDGQRPDELIIERRRHIGVAKPYEAS
jgi:hypothetical protein